MRRATHPLPDRNDWTEDDLREHINVIGELAEEIGLKTRPIQIELVDAEQMLDAYTLGIPVCYHHWRYGKQFNIHHQRYMKGQTHLAYELIANTDPLVAYYLGNNNLVLQSLVTSHACVSADTQYLSPEGWKRIDQYDGGVVGQYEPETGKVHFVQPERYIVNEKVAWLYEMRTERGIVQKNSPDHRVPYVWENNFVPNVATMEDVKQWHENNVGGFQGKFINAFYFDPGTELPFSDDEIRLHIAFQADGSYSDEHEPHTSHRVRFHLKKERKIVRLEMLLRSLGIPYEKKPSYEGRWSILFRREGLPKIFGPLYYQASQRQLQIIRDELVLWDNHGDKGYCSTVKENVIYAQFVFAATGSRAEIWCVDDPRDNWVRKTGYYTQRHNKRTSLLDSGRKSEKKTVIQRIPTEDGRSYCFTVPSGMFVARCEDHIFITGNCFGHGSFFTNNYLFKEWTQPDAIVDYGIFARDYVKRCEEKYGYEKVEETLDAAHALELHGIDKYSRPSPLSAGAEKALQERRMQDAYKEVYELWNTIPGLTPSGKKKPVQEAQEAPEKLFPEHPEENLLYFLEKHSPILETWQREILRIVRKFSQYWYPQRLTRVSNEGFASYWHYTLTYKLWELGYFTDGFMQSFLNHHTSVVHQLDYKHMAGMNPYYLGFNIYQEIGRICEAPTKEDEEWFPALCGQDPVKEILHAAYDFRDDSFILQYLSPRLMRKMRMFALKDDSNKDYYEVIATSNDDGYRKLRILLSDSYNWGYNIPDVQVVEARIKGDRRLTLQHNAVNNVPLDEKEKLAVMKHIRTLWGFDVNIHSSAQPKQDEQDFIIWV